jgi:hypothetical protein
MADVLARGYGGVLAWVALQGWTRTAKAFPTSLNQEAAYTTAAANLGNQYNQLIMLCGWIQGYYTLDDAKGIDDETSLVYIRDWKHALGDNQVHSIRTGDVVVGGVLGNLTTIHVSGTGLTTLPNDTVIKAIVNDGFVAPVQAKIDELASLGENRELSDYAFGIGLDLAQAKAAAEVGSTHWPLIMTRGYPYDYLEPQTDIPPMSIAGPLEDVLNAMSGTAVYSRSFLTAGDVLTGRLTITDGGTTDFDFDLEDYQELDHFCICAEALGLLVASEIATEVQSALDTLGVLYTPIDQIQLLLEEEVEHWATSYPFALALLQGEAARQGDIEYWSTESKALGVFAANYAYPAQAVNLIKKPFYRLI